jgi:hypothetical protein
MSDTPDPLSVNEPVAVAAPAGDTGEPPAGDPLLVSSESKEASVADTASDSKDALATPPSDPLSAPSPATASADKDDNVDASAASTASLSVDKLLLLLKKQTARVDKLTKDLDGELAFSLFSMC